MKRYLPKKGGENKKGLGGLTLCVEEWISVERVLYRLRRSLSEVPIGDTGKPSRWILIGDFERKGGDGGGCVGEVD